MHQIGPTTVRDHTDAGVIMAGGFRRVAGSPAFFILALGLLFATHIVVRLYTSSIASLDEGWQVVLSQHWAWGYHSHPPLYTWLQILCFDAFGESIFTLALLKNALLFVLYAFTYASARLLTRRHDYAAWAALCLLLVPQISWESQRALTHSVLLSATTAATLFTFLWLAQAPSAARYAWLGLCGGLMLLSKYNSALFLAGGAVGCLIVPRYRALLLDRRAWLTAFVALAMVGPPLLWITQNVQEAFASTAKLELRSANTWQGAARLLPGKMVNAALPNFIPLAVIYLAGAFFKGQKIWRLRNDAARMLFWGTVISVALLTIGMFAAKATGMRGRWFQPLFVIGPVLLIAQLETVPRWLFRLAAGVAVAAAVTVIVLMPLNASNGTGPRNMDLTPANVAKVAEHAGATLREADLIVADSFWLGGNMRLAFRKPVITPGATITPYKAGTRLVVVYNPRGPEQVRAEFRSFMETYLGRPLKMHPVYQTPNEDREHTGQILAVAVVE